MSHLHTPPHPHNPSYPPPLGQESLYNTITFVTLCPRPACDLALGVKAAGVHTVHRDSLQAAQAWHGGGHRASSRLLLSPLKGGTRCCLYPDHVDTVDLGGRG